MNCTYNGQHCTGAEAAFYYTTSAGERKNLCWTCYDHFGCQQYCTTIETVEVSTAPMEITITRNPESGLYEVHRGAERIGFTQSVSGAKLIRARARRALAAGK
jgi:hypothetical protein